MAKLYQQKLLALMSDTLSVESRENALEIKHFFNGAAAYVNGVLCISWSPGGLAFKLPGAEVDELIANGKAVPLKYFEKGHVKKGYAAFTDPEEYPSKFWQSYISRAIEFARRS